MMVATTYLGALFLAILTMLCWGSWANTLKLSGKWRFELYYFDYAIGVFLAATIAAFTFGSTDGGATDPSVVAFGFVDSLTIARKLYWIYAFAGGVVFNLANMLLVGAIAVAGLSVAFPVGIGLALIIGVLLNFAISRQGDPLFLFGGSAVVLLAIIVCALAHAAYQKAKGATAAPVAQASVPAGAATGPARRLPARAPAAQRRTAARSPWKGVFLSLGAGLLMGLFYPLVELSKKGDFALSPYAAAFMFALGVLLSTFVFNLFFMNFPVDGPPVSFREYFKGTGKQHLLGLLGGMIWATGAVSNFVAASTPERVNVGPAVSYSLGQGATLISTLWGLLVWREFKGASGRVVLYLVLMLILFVAGLGMVAIAPLMNAK